MEKLVTPTYWPENLAFAWSILFPVSHLGTYKGKKCDKNYSIMNLPRIAYSIGSYCSNPPPNFENIRNITKRTLYTIDILYAVLEKALAFSLNCSTPLAPQWCVAPVFTNHYIESSLVTMVKSGRPWDFLKKNHWIRKPLSNPSTSFLGVWESKRRAMAMPSTTKELLRLPPWTWHLTEDFLINQPL